MEIEAKFAVTGPLSPDQISGLDLDPYHLEDRGVERHNDVVLDTPSRELTAARQTLRIRHTPRATLMTLKGPTTREGAVFTRDEIEAPVSEGAASNPTDLALWPDAIAARIRPLLNGEPLEPLVRVGVARHRWHAIRDGELVAEIALDDGSVQAGGRELPIHELEVEIKAEGTRDDLDALSASLRADLPLAPEPLTKLQRGLALLDGRNPAGQEAVSDLGRQALAAQLDKIRDHEHHARQGDDPDAIHDMRVAVRRTRTMLDVLSVSQAYRRGPLRKLRGRLKRLAGKLGNVRDTDVLLARVADYATRQPDLAADLAPLRDHLQRRRERAQRKLSEYLDSNAYSRAIDDLGALVAGSYGAAEREGEPQTVAAFAGAAIWLRYERALGYDDSVRTRDPQRLHRLRVRCKQLRYTLELFAPRLGPAADPLIEQLKRAQDTLGDMHDATVERELVTQLVEQRPGAAGLAVYGAALDAEADERIAAFVPQWQALSGLAFREPLAALIGAL
ncbi:MAG TPA: CHAD domain-containing protein [Ktedonobacterales bacterium]